MTRSSGSACARAAAERSAGAMRRGSTENSEATRLKAVSTSAHRNA